MYRLVVLVLSAIFILLSCEKDDDVVKDDNNNGGNNEIEVFFSEDFSEWTTITQNNVSYEKPASGWWGSLNTLSTIGGPTTLRKTTDAYKGDYAVRLETKSWGEDLSIVGIMASGYFDKELPIGENLVIGRPFTDKPTNFTGYYKYFPEPTDSLGILVTLTRFNAQNSKRDTVAYAEMSNGKTVSEYTQFSLDIEYYSEETPDSIHIILLSSLRGETMDGIPGSTLYIDDIKLIFE